MTYFFKAKAGLNARAGTNFAGGFGANGDGEIVIGVTYDKDGDEKTSRSRASGRSRAASTCAATRRTSAGC